MKEPDGDFATLPERIGEVSTPAEPADRLDEAPRETPGEKSEGRDYDAV